MSGVFISYRRDDAAAYAGRLYDALTAELGKRAVFIDVDSIRAGDNFVEVIDRWINSSSVVIVLIGKGWLNSRGANGRRLDDPGDFVRLEVASALRRKIPVLPVLVGGAKMPRPDELPEPLAALAHINAIEIFDQLFHDSVRHLIAAVRPFVPRTSFFRGWSRRSLGGLAIFVSILVAALAFGVFFSGPLRNHAANPTQDGRGGEAAPDPSETLAGLEETPAAPVKVTKPGDISELPPVVEASKSIMLPGSSLLVSGPSKPRILWRANVSVGDMWDVWGIAGDGTVYIYDRERDVLDAVRDGKELWAHSAPSPTGFDAEGRIWLKDYTFNSRGEGGQVRNKSLWPNFAKLQSPASWKPSSYSCRDGKVSVPVYGRSKPPWSVDLDGNCGSQDPVVAPQTGKVYVTSDAGTLYAITPDGQVSWSVKGACKDTSYKVYPVLNEDVVVACPHQALYSLRGGKPLWTATLGASGDWFWTDIVSDVSGNIYLGGEGPGITYDLMAFDTAGKQKWTVPAGTVHTPHLLGFDAQGRLYVEARGHLVALSQ